MIRYICAFLVFAAAIGTAAQRMDRNAFDDRELDVRQQLDQLSRLKAGQLAAWRRERTGDAATAQAAAEITPSLLDALRVNYQYASVVLLDGLGREVLTSGEHLLQAGEYRRLAADAASAGSVGFYDVPDRDGAQLVALAAPIARSRRTIVLVADPATSINSSVLQSSLASPASRLVLVRAGETPPAFGADVLTASAAVPSSSWTVIAAIDRNAAFAPLADDRRQIVTSAALLILLCAISLGLIWRHQRAEFYRHQYEAEAERQALRGHYDYLTRYANDALVLTDDSGRLIEVNDRAVEMYGFEREDLLEMNICELRSPASRLLFDEHWALVRECGSLVYEVDQRRRDGSVFPVEASTRVIRTGGQIFRQTSVRDITVRRRAEAAAVEQDRQRQVVEEQLRISRDRLERVLDAAEEAYWDRNVATGELVLSPRWYTMLGYVPGEIRFTWTSLVELVHPDDHLSDADHAEFRLRCKSGEYIWVRSRGKTIERDGAGRPLRRIGTLSDITDSKKLETQVLQSQKLESLGRIAGGVAHDFNSLLTVINGYVDLVLAQSGSDATRTSHLQAIKQAGHRAAALTQQLLTFSRQQQVQPRLLSLNATIVEIEGLLRRIAGDRVELETQLDAADGAVTADLTQMQQVLMNLVANARDAMPDGGRITIQTSTAGGRVRLSVRDTGTGMDEETRAQMFEPFFTTKPAGKGTGLGLSTVYGVVRRTGGSIRVDSEPGQGTAFEIDFPLADATACPEETVLAAAAPVTADGLAAGRPTVLVVDDDENIRTLLAEALDGERFDVLTAADGADAIDIIRREAAVDIVLTDLFMPNVEGLEVIREVRALRPDLRIVAMSGVFGGAFLAGATRAGVDATVQKPVDLTSLQQTLEGLLAA